MIAPAIFALALSAVHVAAVSQPAPGDYRLRSSYPPTGSMIRDTISWSNSIPLDRPYERFTPEQKAALKSAYVNLESEDEPPFPDQGLAPILSAVSRIIGAKWYEGEVLMHVAIDAAGSAREFKLIKYPNLEIAKAVATVVAVTKFKPAKCAGQPCAMDYPLHLRLVLR